MTELWAKARNPGKGTRGPFHNWEDGVSTCPQARGGAGPSQRSRRTRRPWNACKECIRILNGQPPAMNRRHAATA